MTKYETKYPRIIKRNKLNFKRPSTNWVECLIHNGTVKHFVRSRLKEVKVRKGGGGLVYILLKRIRTAQDLLWKRRTSSHALSGQGFVIFYIKTSSWAVLELNVIKPFPPFYLFLLPSVNLNKRSKLENLAVQLFLYFSELSAKINLLRGLYA